MWMFPRQWFKVVRGQQIKNTSQNLPLNSSVSIEIVKNCQEINTFIHGPVWKMVNTWPKKFLCYPLSKFGVFGFLIPWIFRKKTQRNKKKSWFLVISCCFCFVFHANLMSDGKKERLKFLFITPLILLISMLISLFRWIV